MEDILQERSTRVEDAFRLLQNNKDSLSNIPGIVRQLMTLHVWEGYNWQGKTVSFSSFREFVETSPPEGLGTTVDELIGFCRKYPEIADQVNQLIQEQKPIYKPPVGLDKRPKSRGSYRRNLQRLRVLAENDQAAMKLRKQVLAGEISLRQALISLGVERKKYSIEASSDAVVAFIQKHLNSEQVKDVLDMLSP